MIITKNQHFVKDTRRVQLLLRLVLIPLSAGMTLMDPHTIVVGITLTTVHNMETSLKMTGRQQIRHAAFVVGGEIYLLPLLLPVQKIHLLLVQLPTLLVVANVSARTMIRNSSSQQLEKEVASS